MSKKNLWIKILIPVIAIIVIVGGVYMVSNRDKTTEKTPTVEETKGDNTEENNKSDEPNTNNEEENSEEKIDTSTSKYVDEAELPEWTNCNLSFGNTDVQLPISYANFKKLTGYSFEELDEDGVFPANEYDDYTLLANENGDVIIVTLENRTRDELSLQECTITKVCMMSDLSEINESEHHNYPRRYTSPTDIIFPQNSKLGDTSDEFEEKFGKPFDSVSNLEGTYYSEYWSINDIYTFSATFQDGKCVSMSIETKSL